MDLTTVFSKYAVTNEFISLIQPAHIQKFVNAITPAWYALRLEGKTLYDIEATDTVRALFPFASALLVPEYMHKKKHILKKEIIDKYNSVFASVIEAAIISSDGIVENEQKEKEELEDWKEEKEQQVEQKEQNDSALVTYRYGHLFLPQQDIISTELLPKLSLHDFFRFVNFSSESYMFDLDFWLQLNNLDNDTMFIVEDDITDSFGYKDTKTRTDNSRSNFL